MAQLHHPIFSPIVMEHFTSPRHEGPLSHVDVQGSAGPAEVVTIQMALKSRGIFAIGFTLTEATPVRRAAASVLCAWAWKQALDTADLFTEAALTTRLGGVPAQHAPDVAMVFRAFRRALAAAHQASPPDGVLRL